MNQSTDTSRSSTDAGAATRADLISAGRALFAQRGFDGSSIRAITQHAGANLGSVTYHFGSKRALYAAVLEAGLRPLAARIHVATRSEGSALDRIVKVVEAYFEHFQTHPDVPHLLLQEVAAGKPPPPVVRDIVSGVKAALVQLHRDGIADGSIRPGHALLTALSVVSQPVYLTLVAPLLRSVGGLDLDDPDTRTMAVTHAADFVRSALAANQG